MKKQTILESDSQSFFEMYEIIQKINKDLGTQLQMPKIYDADSILDLEKENHKITSEHLVAMQNLMVINYHPNLLYLDLLLSDNTGGFVTAKVDYVHNPLPVIDYEAIKDSSIEIMGVYGSGIDTAVNVILLATFNENRLTELAQAEMLKIIAPKREINLIYVGKNDGHDDSRTNLSIPQNPQLQPIGS